MNSSMVMAAYISNKNTPSPAHFLIAFFFWSHRYIFMFSRWWWTVQLRLYKWGVCGNFTMAACNTWTLARDNGWVPWFPPVITQAILYLDSSWQAPDCNLSQSTCNDNINIEDWFKPCSVKRCVSSPKFHYELVMGPLLQAVLATRIHSKSLNSHNEMD